MSNALKPAQNNIRLVARLAVVVVGMFGFGYAMVPIYNVLCDITGLNGKNSNLAEQNNRQFEVDEERMVRVEFLTNLNQGLSWEFRPEISSMRVHPGKRYTANFVAVNNTANAMVGQAIPSIAPSEAASHFHKTECFCFSNQPFEAGESKQMPVVFVVDPDLPDRVDTLTLSYTFFDVSETTDVKQGTFDNSAGAEVAVVAAQID